MHVGWKVKWAGMVTTSGSRSLTAPQMLSYQALWKQNYGQGRNRMWKRKTSAGNNILVD